MDKKNNDKKNEIIIGIVVAIFIIGMITFVLNRNDRQTNNYSSKADYDEFFNAYSIIKQESMHSIKARIDVRLNRKFNKSSIEKLARKLKNDLKVDYDRIFISYYLPGMKVGSGAWATSHFNPDLNIVILGLSEASVDKLKENYKENQTEDKIGTWVAGMYDEPYLIVFFKKNGKVYMSYRDEDDKGGILDTEFIIKNVNGQKRYIDKGSAFGEEYYIINSDGELEVYDNYGFIERYKKFKAKQ